mmetsp:Transcript_17607/g.56093  ORF Transcript_17607/g.56093 Transcript_17607/m.56093 type:complete len:303 (+) Transcript_17607:430-1338(+)
MQPPLDRVVSAHEVAVRREEARLAAWPEVEEDDRLRERLAPESEVADVARDRGAQPKGDPARLARGAGQRSGEAVELTAAPPCEPEGVLARVGRRGVGRHVVRLRVAALGVPAQLPDLEPVDKAARNFERRRGAVGGEREAGRRDEGEPLGLDPHAHLREVEVHVPRWPGAVRRVPVPQRQAPARLVPRAEQPAAVEHRRRKVEKHLDRGGGERPLHRQRTVGRLVKLQHQRVADAERAVPVVECAKRDRLRRRLEGRGGRGRRCGEMLRARLDLRREGDGVAKRARAEHLCRLGQALEARL